MGNNISSLRSEETSELETSKTEVDGLKFTKEQLNLFIKMFEKDRVLKDFINFDRCCVLADKYLLAMSFVYFVRAGLKPTEYGRFNFFSALYLAHMMEEDDSKLRYNLFPWALAPSTKIRRQPLLRNVKRMWVAMECRSVVSQFSCQQVIKVCPDADIWQRERPPHHGNAYRLFKKCSNCVPKGFNDFLEFYDFEDDVYMDTPKASKQAIFDWDENCDSEEENSGENSPHHANSPASSTSSVSSAGETKNDGSSEGDSNVSDCDFDVNNNLNSVK